MTATATAYDYDYDDQCVSDLHKEAYGFRPSRRYLNKWEEMTPAQKQTEWDYLCRESDDRADEERRLTERLLGEFDSWLRKTEEQAGSVENALCWMTQEDRDNGWMKHSQDAEHWVWNQGFLFTDRGREVVEMLKRIYKMEY